MVSLHKARLNLSVKVLDFVQCGGPNLTVDNTLFELVVAFELSKEGKFESRWVDLIVAQADRGRQLQREDGPVIEEKGRHEWYSYGRLHREYGPAIQNACGA